MKSKLSQEDKETVYMERGILPQKKTANNIGVSQSTVSRAIKEIDDKLDKDYEMRSNYHLYFDNSKKTSEITYQGITFYEVTYQGLTF